MSTEQNSSFCGAVDRYDQLWNAGRPDLNEFLRTTPPLNPDDFAGVLRLDQRRRWRAGERIPAEDYLRRLGECSPDDEAAVDLIFQEFLLREQVGEHPDVEELIGRFPAYADVLRAQIDLHRAIAAESTGHGGLPAQTGAIDAGALEQPVPRMFGRYEIERTLGRGSMGVVYLARDTTLDRLVALKVPHLGLESPAVVERFRREAMAAAAVHHPNLCPVFDVSQIDGIDFLTMPFISGESLAARFKRDGSLPANEAAQLVFKAAAAMEVAHHVGIIHRDLKPANILINEHGEPVVTDFGLARRGSSTDSSLTEPGTVLGTPAYMPPEQVGCDPATLGPRGDIYSLGVILYEALTGRPPFTGSSMSVLEQVLTKKPESPSQHCPGLDPALAKVCLRAMAKMPEERFASMADFAAALAPFTDGQRPSDKLVVRSQWKRIAATCAIVLLSIAIVLFIWQWKQNRAEPSAKKDVDSFLVGSVWTGKFRFLPPIREYEGAVTLTVTARASTQFRAIYVTEDTFQWDAEGETADGDIRWRLVKPLNDAAKSVTTEIATVQGRYADRQIDATYTDANSRAQITLRLRE